MYKRTSIVLDVVRQTPYLPIRAGGNSVFPPRTPLATP